jgi:iron complex transport system substrate-binding protein
MLRCLPPQVLLSVLILASGCQVEGGEHRGREPQGKEREAALVFEDDADRVWAFQEPPTRWVSLVPSATALLMELGGSELLVGRSEYDLDPRLAEVASVGGGLEPSLEALLATRPDLVLRFHGPSDPVTPARLDALGIPHLALRFDTVEDILRISRSLGALAGRPEAGDSLALRIEGALEAVRAQVLGAEPLPVAILLGGDPPWAATEGSYMHQVVELAGGRNVLADLGPLYGPVSVEEILIRAPQALLLSENGRVPEGLRGIPVIRTPPSLGIPGPGVREAALEMARRLHPERFR